MKQSIARRYRPQVFADVTGQEPIVQTLANALTLGRVAHAYLFSGTHGTGKTTLARLFAKAINCESRAGTEPCNTCSSCIEINQGSSLDVIEIDGASNRGIEDIRSLSENVGYASANGRYKIIIIDEVHMLTKEAFNALLKTLEEPPEHVKFFFATTEPNKVLPTILSRCQRFDLSRIETAQIQKKLSSICSIEGLDVEEKALALIATLGAGSMRDAESILDQISCRVDGHISEALIRETLGLTTDEEIQAFDAAMQHRDLSFPEKCAKALFSAGKDLPYFVEALMRHFLSSPATYTDTQRFTALDILTDWLEKIQKTPFKEVHLEILLLQLIRSMDKVTIESLVDRLEALEGRVSTKKATPPPPPVKPAPVAAPPPVKPAPVAAPPPVKPAPVAAPPPKPTPITPPPPSQEGSGTPTHVKHDRVMQFTSVELGGQLTKE